MNKILKKRGELILLFFFWLIFYSFFQTKSIYGGDSGDLVTAAWFWGIPHPPGYPFYTLVASFLIHLLPFFTPSWRVGFISSLSSALSLTFFYLLTKILISQLINKDSQGNNNKKNNKSASYFALLASLILGFIYPFWLYSEVAEVFSLNNLFTILLVYLFFSFLGRGKSKESKKDFQHKLFKQLLWFFILGLALTHQQTIILLMPAFLLLYHRNKKQFIQFFKKHNSFPPRIFKARIKNKLIAKHRVIILPIFAFLLGLSFYLYPLLACRKQALVCWDNPVNLKNLIRLVSRADYGTFRSNVNLGQAPILRLYSALSAFKLIKEDFKALGIVFILLGFFYTWKKNKNLFFFLTVTLLTNFFFLFYASFVLVNDFMVATWERFLILPYIFLVLSLILGIIYLMEKIKKILQKINFDLQGQAFLLKGIKLLLFLFPLSLFLINFQKIPILRNDLTAEAMAKDFLAPLPAKSILIVSSDTAVFDLQYVRYVLGFRNDLIVLSRPMLTVDHYQLRLKQYFPQLKFSEKVDQRENFKEFLQLNSTTYNIFVDRRIFIPEENWLPFGLSWQYLPQEQQPEIEKIVAANLSIWKAFSSPLEGSLAKFENLFLADVLRIYQDAQLNFSAYLFNHNYLDQALAFSQEAEKLKPDNEEVYLYQGMVFLEKKDCQKAKESFLKALAIDKNNVSALGFLRQTAAECFENSEEANFFEEQCTVVQEKKEIFLENLGQ